MNVGGNASQTDLFNSTINTQNTKVAYEKGLNNVSNTRSRKTLMQNPHSLHYNDNISQKHYNDLVNPAFNAAVHGPSRKRQANENTFQNATSTHYGLPMLPLERENELRRSKGDSALTQIIDSQREMNFSQMKSALERQILNVGGDKKLA